LLSLLLLLQLPLLLLLQLPLLLLLQLPLLLRLQLPLLLRLQLSFLLLLLLQPWRLPRWALAVTTVGQQREREHVQSLVLDHHQQMQ
jgi:hypothetical protein